ncbi:prepilin-type N-terminal cleavage/methylation domain-containing protein [bacterium]|nr:prepilin-type N-terminal cleavage/methylation domain-containing protein [bacterium]
MSRSTSTLLSRKENGFTLVELLITLGIIGIVLSMTIPVVAHEVTSRDLVSRFLKMHRVFSEALNETEAMSGLNIRKMDEATFKEELEASIKMFGDDGGCGGSEKCLIDGSGYSYGTFHENCPNDICMEITVDVNGINRPNEPGKDIYKLYITPDGVRTPGTDDFCEFGYDCGSYVLAHHDLYENGSAPANELYDGVDECRTQNISVCRLTNGETAQKIGEMYVSEQSGSYNWTDAMAQCAQKGLRLATKEELVAISEAENGKTGWYWSASEFDSGNAYGVNLGTGTVDYGTKTGGFSTMCVYD